MAVWVQDSGSLQKEFLILAGLYAVLALSVFFISHVQRDKARTHPLRNA